MNDKDKTPETGAAAEAAATEAFASATASSHASTDGGEGERVAALEAEKVDLRDRLMRALADAENMRRRSEREAADARTYAVTNFARDMLNVADNIRRALESAGQDSATAEGPFKTLLEGIELTERDLLTTLGRHGVKKLEPEGSKFDPNMHQAMFEVPRDDIPGGTVVQVVQTGYAIGERVLRPALVGVSKGQPKAAQTSAPAEGAGNA